VAHGPETGRAGHAGPPFVVQVQTVDERLDPIADPVTGAEQDGVGSRRRDQRGVVAGQALGGLGGQATGVGDQQGRLLLGRALEVERQEAVAAVQHGSAIGGVQPQRLAQAAAHGDGVDRPLLQQELGRIVLGLPFERAAGVVALADRQRPRRRVGGRQHHVGPSLVGREAQAGLDAGAPASPRLEIARDHGQVRAAIVSLQHQVDHAADRGGAVNAAGRGGQGLDPFDRAQGDGVEVALLQARRARRQAGQPPAVDQDQGSLLADAAQVDRGIGAGGAVHILAGRDHLRVGRQPFAQVLVDIVLRRDGQVARPNDLIGLDVVLRAPDVGVLAAPALHQHFGDRAVARVGDRLPGQLEKHEDAVGGDPVADAGALQQQRHGLFGGEPALDRRGSPASHQVGGIEDVDAVLPRQFAQGVLEGAGADIDKAGRGVGGVRGCVSHRGPTSCPRRAQISERRRADARCLFRRLRLTALALNEKRPPP
jgi:hypothetical protein